MENSGKIPFNFTYFAMKLLGKNLYSNPWTAISEIVANGIDAKAGNIYVLIDMRNKDKAIVEIFDDGLGMSYRDLSEKYTLIGRNKRLDTENIEGKTLGRKGIGKLAALYLSSSYSLYTKTSEYSSAWSVDTRAMKDSDIPAMYEVSVDTNVLIAKDKWNTLKTGTMIHLSNVDLRKIGAEKLKSLPIVLADYYLDSVITSNILVSVIASNYDEIIFKKIEKKINYKTLFGIFDNTTIGHKSKVQEKVYLTKNTVYEEVDIPRKTVILNLQEDKYGTSGEIELRDLNGEIKKINYNMTGWIGIHASIDADILVRSFSDYKKIVYHPNALRLYVRGKLAVDNLMNYVRSNSAFANYIEGEISFDVLDDDLFEDASTSNREGYSISDPRIKLLIEIVSKIITSLIVERNKAGHIINTEMNEIKQRIDREKEEERKRKEEADRQAREAIAAQKLAEEKAEQAIEQGRIIKKQFYFLEGQLTRDDKVNAYNTHVIKNNAERISGNIFNLILKNPEFKKCNELRSISIATNKILSAVKYYNHVAYSLENKKLTGNLTTFIKEYIEKVCKSSYDEILTRVGEDINCNLVFHPQDITVMIDNIYSNAKKYGANEIEVIFERVESKIVIRFINDGEFLPENVDKELLFEFGYTTADNKRKVVGTGVGLYQVYDTIVSKMKGNVDIYNNANRGITLEVIINEI